MDLYENGHNSKKQFKKRSIAQKLATNIKRQSVDYSLSEESLRNSYSMQENSKNLSRKISKVEEDEEDRYLGHLDSSHRFENEYLSGHPSSVNKMSHSYLSHLSENNKNNLRSNGNGSNSLREFDKGLNSRNKNLYNSKLINGNESENLSEDFDEEDKSFGTRHVKSKLEQQKLKKNYSSEDKFLRDFSTFDLYGSGKKSQNPPLRANPVPSTARPPNNRRISPPSPMSERKQSKHFRSSPNIANSKDFTPWSPLRKKDDEDESIESSKMTNSSSVLSMVNTEKMRNRGYLADSTNLGLLGIDELTRLFPDKRIRVHISTWNAGEIKSVPISLNELLLPKISEVAFDIYVVGTQETAFDRQEWNIKIQETLGPHFVLFHSASHGTLSLVVFIRRDLIWFFSAPEDSSVTTRMGPSNIKTKGAIAIGFIFFGSSFLFINSHFKAHEGKFEDRIEDYKKISSMLNFPTIFKPKLPNNSTTDMTSQFDSVFWMGDLNSRMEMKREKIGGAMSSGEIRPGEIEKLMQFDELKRLMNQELAFKEFSEGRIRFLPTYKFDVGTNKYDTSNKNRNPSYTDRVLYRSRKKGTIACLHYNSSPTFLQSDHKPVYGVFEVELRPGIDSIPLSGGLFNRDIWLEGTKRRMTHQTFEQQKTDNGSSVCVMM